MCAVSAAMGVAVVAPSALGADDEVGAQEAQVGGPVLILGIDVEDGGPDNHGDFNSWLAVVTNAAAGVGNGGTGMLVLGGDKSADDVTDFWDAVSSGTGIPVTYANGAAVGTQPFAGFAIVVVVTGDDQVDGGLDAAECQALAARPQDFFDHVNGGGGLIAFAQEVKNSGGCEYAFFGGFGSLTFTNGLDYNAIAPTPEGLAAGITTALNADDWHTTYQTFPSFLQVLATVAPGDFDGDEEDCNIPDSTSPSCVGQIAAIGGARVTIPDPAPEPVVVTPMFTG